MLCVYDDHLCYHLWNMRSRCIKVADEAPSDLKSNLRRAYSKFSQELWRFKTSRKCTAVRALEAFFCPISSNILNMFFRGSRRV